jgi:hypothetical protein
MAANPQLLTGARGLIQRVNSNGTFETIAFSTDISVNIRHGVRPTFVVGKMNAGAIDSITYDVDVSVGRVIPMQQASPAAASVGVGSDGASTVLSTTNVETAIGIGLEELINAMVSADDLQIALQDKVTETFPMRVQNCRFAGRSINSNAGDISNERLRFIGIYDAGQQIDGAPENSAIIGYGL